MSDYASGLPIRSEADSTDNRVHVKIVDGATPAQMATVDTDLNVHVEIHGNDPTNTDKVIKTSEQGSINLDGIYDVSNNTEPSNVGIVAHTRAASPGDAQQVIRLTGIDSGTVNSLDVAIRDESGLPFTESNPLPVTFVDSEGSEVNDYLKSTAVAATASSNHDYTVTALKTLKMTAVWATASGKLKIEVQVESGVASGVFATKFVGFNSTASPNIPLPIGEPIAVAAGVRVRVIRTNLDNQSQDLYSTIEGHEI